MRKGQSGFMTGLELSRRYYEECGRPMLEREFPDLLPLLAIGAVGSGSDRYGFDDELSRDHDFEPGFCLFLPGEDVVDRRQAFLLERAYAKLPKEFSGFRRQPLSPVGGNRNGVLRTAEFYTFATGDPEGQLTVEQWLLLPDSGLAESVNGEVFFDEYGEFSAIRKRLSHMPEDIRKKRMAGNLLLMGQAGQYNLSRCLRRGEIEAAQLACNEFVNAALKVIFLLRRKYAPYYKWSFRALRALEGTEEYARLLSSVLTGDLRCADTAENKLHAVERLAVLICEELRKDGISGTDGNRLEQIAYSVNDSVENGEIRNLSIFAAVSSPVL